MIKDKNFDEELRVTVPLTIRVSGELKETVGLAADAARRPMNEIVAEILAKHFGRPELAEIPRKQLGRPRGRNKPNGHKKNGRAKKELATR